MTREDDFQHFLSYSGLSGQEPNEINHLRVAFEAGSIKQNGVICPFCGECDFDLFGLKMHLTIPAWCPIYSEITEVAG